MAIPGSMPIGQYLTLTPGVAESGAVSSLGSPGSSPAPNPVGATPGVAESGAVSSLGSPGSSPAGSLSCVSLLRSYLASPTKSQVVKARLSFSQYSVWDAISSAASTSACAANEATMTGSP